MRELLHHPQVKQLLQGWENSLADAGGGVTNRIDEALAACNLSDWSRKQFWDEVDSIGTIPFPYDGPGESNAKFRSGVDAVLAFRHRLREVRPGWELEARKLASKLGLGLLPWLPADLADWGEGRALGMFGFETTPQTYRCWLDMPEPPTAIAFEIVFRREPGEPLKTARRRLLHMFRAAAKQAQSTRRRRAKSDMADRYEEYGRWFYRRRVLGQPFRTIARDYHDGQGHRRPFVDCDDRKTVRDGVAAAERVLQQKADVFSNLY